MATYPCPSSSKYVADCAPNVVTFCMNVKVLDLVDQRYNVVLAAISPVGVYEFAINKCHWFAKEKVTIAVAPDVQKDCTTSVFRVHEPKL
jgi:hypothetical protein